MFNGLYEQILNDPKRDVIFLHLMAKWTFVHLAFALYLLLICDENSRTFNICIPIYIALWLHGMDQYTLGLHCVSHRQIFKPKWAWLQKYYVWVLGILFGQSPETYYAHHIGMHHTENNGTLDLSSTMTHVRDSYLSFYRYYLGFLMQHPFIYQYFWHHNRKLVRRFFVGELFYWALAISVAALKLKAGILLFGWPVMFVRFVMMCGNWAQHAFIKDNQASDNWLAAIVIIDSKYNARCFNDGYHILHHRHPSCHYTELPTYYEKEKKELGAHDSVVFHTLDYFGIWGLLMLKRYDILASFYVDLRPEEKRTKKDIMTMLRARTRPN